MLGVTVTRIALLTHCQALTQACGYTEGTATPMGARPWAAGMGRGVPSPHPHGRSGVRFVRGSDLPVVLARPPPAWGGTAPVALLLRTPVLAGQAHPCGLT